MASGPLTPTMPATHLPATIKMEDLQVPFDTPSPHDSQQSEAASTPAPTGSESKPVKKRKSWGQVLPEPKTSLPPRKRAKTEDEKEQRRIERVKRNRLAAHNSRERKRQEYELLQAEKDTMEDELKSFRQEMAQIRAELNYFRSKYPNERPDVSFDLEASSTVCPARTSVSFPSPVSMDSMDSPRDSSCQPETPASSFEATPNFDSTQYPAVSVDFGYGLPLAGGDMGLSYSLPAHATIDEKPVVLDNLFDFDQFPEGNSTLESSMGMADSSVDFFDSALFGHSSFTSTHCNPDGFDAKLSDLQSASGATYVSDEALAVEL